MRTDDSISALKNSGGNERYEIKTQTGVEYGS